MTSSKSKALYFFAGLVLGGLLTYMLTGAFQDSPTPWTIPEGPRLSTSAGPRVGLPLPDLPRSTTNPAIVDVKTTDWKLRKLDSTEVSFSEFAGRVIFLNLWGTWCQPCVWEMPYLQHLYDAVKEDSVEFLIVSDEPLEKIKAFAARERLHMPIYQSASKKPPGFEAQGWPATMILSKSGSVVMVELGAARWSDPSVIKFIRSLSK
jgi:thiol-disulfide isomerase/thioredoxin